MCLFVGVPQNARFGVMYDEKLARLTFCANRTRIFAVTEFGEECKLGFAWMSYICCRCEPNFLSMHVMICYLYHMWPIAVSLVYAALFSSTFILMSHSSSELTFWFMRACEPHLLN